MPAIPKKAVPEEKVPAAVPKEPEPPPPEGIYQHEGHHSFSRLLFVVCFACHSRGPRCNVLKGTLCLLTEGFFFPVWQKLDKSQNLHIVVF